MADDLPRKAGMNAFDPHKTRLFHSPGPRAQAAGTSRKRPPPLPAARPDWHDKTRVLPIEHLLPRLNERVRATRHDTAALHRPARVVPRLSKQRVYAWAVCLVLWVSVAAASGMPSQVPQSTLPEAVTIRTSVPVAERPRSAPAAAQPSTPAPAAKRTVTTPPPPAANRAAALTTDGQARPIPTARVSPRAAFEAMAAGDSLAASHLYVALARQHPDNLAYARAARILTQRVQTEAKARGVTP